MLVGLEVREHLEVVRRVLLLPQHYFSLIRWLQTAHLDHRTLQIELPLLQVARFHCALMRRRRLTCSLRLHFFAQRSLSTRTLLVLEAPDYLR